MISRNGCMEGFRWRKTLFWVLRSYLLLIFEDEKKVSVIRYVKHLHVYWDISMYIYNYTYILLAYRYLYIIYIFPYRQKCNPQLMNVIKAIKWTTSGLIIQWQSHNTIYASTCTEQFCIWAGAHMKTYLNYK